MSTTNATAIDTVQIATRCYNTLHTRKHAGETITAAEWTACGKDLQAAAETFDRTSDYYNFCADRAQDCEHQAFRANLTARVA